MSESLCETLVTEDYVVQSMDDVSPTKWHLAHTSWFFETFLLRDRPGYEPYDPNFEYLFNSYYNAVGPQFHRPHRGLLSRPTVAEVYDYRRHVDKHMGRLIEAARTDADMDRETRARILKRTILGLHHEQQHQELILMDIKHVFWTNPLRPVLRVSAASPSASAAPPLRWFQGPEGLHEIGHGDAGFCYDNETPRHTVFLAPFEIASRCVTNAEYLAFIEDGGYSRCELWLSDGWDVLQSEGWEAPLYWERRDGAWYEMTLGGMKPLDPHASVAHVSHYEADAYARWAGVRLPTESEWEAVAAPTSAADIERGNFVESRRLHPTVAPEDAERPTQLFGNVWEWTASSYLPYPGYCPAEGAIGEYNGKFMSGQMVLRGGACATSASHIRASYRNFFPARSRWPFTGIRLARSTAPERDMVAVPGAVEAISDYAPEREQFRQEVVAGLSQPEKRLSSKYFYDERGSELFERICELDEYYPTRTELAIMRAHAPEMVAAIGPGCVLIEYGSGASLKTRILLDRLPDPVGYAPVEISREHLLRNAADLAAEYPHVPVYPICADFTAAYELPEEIPASARRVVYFPGSTIGNFPPAAARDFLGHLAEVCRPGGGALIGIDRQKSPATLEAAYNDAEGVTAAFNLNLLTRINRELGADFDLARFAHRAAYDRERGCIEMRLESLAEQTVSVDGVSFDFGAGETIHTEYSFKYTIEGFRDLAAPAGFSIERIWSDPDELFSVVYLECQDPTR